MNINYYIIIISYHIDLQLVVVMCSLLPAIFEIGLLQYVGKAHYVQAFTLQFRNLSINVIVSNVYQSSF